MARPAGHEDRVKKTRQRKNGRIENHGDDFCPDGFLACAVRLSRRVPGMLAATVLATAACMLLPAPAQCRLSAEVDLGYINYDVRNNSGQHLSAQSFAQRYSLLYTTAGKLVNGRLGSYDLALGYELNTFDTNISSDHGSDNPSQTRGHLNFKGDVTIDPKEVPFKLRLYSRDMSRTYYNYDTSGILGFYTGGSPINGDLSSSSNQVYGGFSNVATTFTNSINGLPNVPTNVTDGMHIQSGATLVMGVKNGMTNGYNEFLRHFPMLLLDYRDEVNKDLGSIYPVNNRLQRLAFVSLNKKDNWFHYRHYRYSDYLEPYYNNYVESQLQLGTVDHLLQRRWIDFSNWIKVSADGMLTRHEEPNAYKNYDEFTLNLFGMASRATWEARSFTNFTRLKEHDDLITYKTSVPVYARGTLSPTVSWSAYTTYNEDKTNKGDQFTRLNTGYTVDAFSKSPFTLRQSLGFELVSSSDNSDIQIITGDLGTTSTAAFSRAVSLGAQYTIRNYRYDTNAAGSNFTAQELNGTATYAPSNQLRVTFRQTARATSGAYKNIQSNIAGASISSIQYEAPRSTATSGQNLQSITSLAVAWNPRPRLNASLTVSEDVYFPSSGKESTVTNADATFSYSTNHLTVTSRNRYSKGEGSNSYNANQASSENSLRYIFNRNLDARIGFAYYKSLGGDDGLSQLNAEQALNYYYYTTNGITRKLFEVNESFTSVEQYESEAFAAATPVKRRSNQFSLGAKYYPLRQMLVSAGTKYTFVDSIDNYTLSYYGSVGVNFKMLEASLDYSYGKNKADGRVEKRFAANVKKRF